MSMDIYYGRHRDLDAVMEIERASFTDAWSEDGVAASLEDPDGGLLAASEDGRLMGYAIFHCSFEDCELYSVAVSPACRRRGIGRELVSAVIHEARSRGASRLLLEVRRSNLPARAMYDSMGFTAIGERKNYYDAPREDAVIMELEL